MARAIIILELDGGSRMEVEERSILPNVAGGADAVLLVQAAFERIAGACGIRIQAPPEPPQAPAPAPVPEDVDTGDTEPDEPDEGEAPRRGARATGTKES